MSRPALGEESYLTLDGHSASRNCKRKIECKLRCFEILYNSFWNLLVDKDTIVVPGSVAKIVITEAGMVVTETGAGMTGAAVCILKGSAKAMDIPGVVRKKMGLRLTATEHCAGAGIPPLDNTITMFCKRSESTFERDLDYYVLTNANASCKSQTIALTKLSIVV